MKCAHCGKELFVQDEQEKLTECPFCHQDPKIEVSGAEVSTLVEDDQSSAATSSMTMVEKGLLMHALAFVLIVIQYLICISNPLESGLSFNIESILVGGLLVFGAFGWMSKGSVIPVIAFTILNVVFLMDEGLSADDLRL